MSQRNPHIRAFARRLMAHDAARGRVPGRNDASSFPVLDQLGLHLAALIGRVALSALLARALALAGAEDAGLQALEVKTNATVEGWGALGAQVGPAELLAAKAVLLAQFLGLLVAFIGPGVTMTLIGDIWPQLSLDVSELSTGDKNEKAN